MIVAALVADHPHHERASPWLRASLVDAAVCCHALAETWAVLTALPLEPRLSGHDAARMVEALAAAVTVRPLGARHYDEALRRCADRGLRSGAVYDALHLVGAEAAKVDALVTFNAGDFERLLVEESPPAIVPPDPPHVSVPRRRA